MKHIIPSLCWVLVALVGARVIEASPADVQRAAEDGAVEAGCYFDCPACIPEGPCPKDACQLVCPSEMPCGETTCSGGLVCCNPSCGVCAPPDGYCSAATCASASASAASF